MNGYVDAIPSSGSSAGTGENQSKEMILDCEGSGAGGVSEEDVAAELVPGCGWPVVAWRRAGVAVTYGLPGVGRS